MAVGRVVTQALATVRPHRADPIAAERVVLDELEVLLCPDQRTGVARKGDDRKSPEDGIDRTPLETELTQVRTIQERSRRGEKLPGRRMTRNRWRVANSFGAPRAGSGLGLPFHIEPELLRVLLQRHKSDCSKYVTRARNASDAYDRCMTSGTLIRQARMRAGLSQVQLAERSSKDRAQIARWERDTVTPSLETLRELLRACGFDLDLSLVPYRGPDAQLEARLGKGLERTPQERLQTMLKARRR